MHEPGRVGTTSVCILIPSRHKNGGILARELKDKWQSEAQSELSKPPFGGCTPEHVIGNYRHDDGRVTREDVVRLRSGCDEDLLRNNEVKDRIFNFGRSLCSNLAQECVLISWGKDTYLVSGEDREGVDVIRFTDLSEDSQVKYLYLGWAGIAAPGQILQLLSLDGWIGRDDKHQEDPCYRHDLRRVAILDEGAATRSAWIVKGDLISKGDLTHLGKQRFKSHRVMQGDLIFFASERDQEAPENMILVAMYNGRGLDGPRDLLCSHGQLNPVTRQTLLRILRREWDELRKLLKQKPLDQGFFPELKRLQRDVEDTLYKRLVALPTLGRQKKSDLERSASGTAFRYSILIVGRMMFLRFIVQKGWLPGGVTGLADAFQQYKDLFFKRYIQNLWFQVFNKPIEQRPPDVRRLFSDEYPYLNGGLFAPRPGEEEYVDLPPTLFDPTRNGSFLWLFNEYEFSLNEHGGTDDTLKIDPSIFGRILESFNSSEDRKKAGIHYTPKSVARAMAMEGILNRVAHLTGIARTTLDAVMSGQRCVDGAGARRISSGLTSLRVIDPAVGSGVLLWACLEVLLELDSYCDGIERGADGYQRGSHKWGEKGRHFVSNCLYGVDVSEEAIELSRLRLWLAVALSDERPTLLPDLELNLSQGDSLLFNWREPDQPQASLATDQFLLPLDERNQLFNDLIQSSSEYANGGNSPNRQRELREKVQSIRRRLAASGTEPLGKEPDFNWKLFFPHAFEDPEKKGFDLVIANPPYVRIQGIPENSRKVYRNQWTTLMQGSADLSYAFVELALKNLAAADGGQISFIQPNFRLLDAAQTLRSFLLGKDPNSPCRLNLWVDFQDQQVFPTATNYVALIFASRVSDASAQASFEYSNPEEKDWKNGEGVEWLRPINATDNHSANAEWITLPRQIRENLRLALNPEVARLGDFVNIECGVQTSADEVYLFQEHKQGKGKTVLVRSKRDEGDWIVLEEDIVRPCMKGAAEKEHFLLFPYDSAGALLNEQKLKADFPLAWKYLDKRRKKLSSRKLSKTAPLWYAFGRQQGTKACNKKKVLVPSLLLEPKARIDASGYLTFTASGKGGGGGWALSPKDNTTITIQQIYEAVVSPLAWSLILAFGSPQLGGWRGVDKQVLSRIPLSGFTH
jgi:methylase of polypeptide subunit release factors